MGSNLKSLCVLSFRQKTKKTQLLHARCTICSLLHDAGGVNIACKTEIVPDISSKYFVGQRVHSPHDKAVGGAANEKTSLECLLYSQLHP